MKKRGNTMLIIVALLLAGLLAYGWTQGMFEGITVAGEGGAATIAFAVQFTDGTTQTFESSDVYRGKLSVMPLTLYVGGKQIASINIDVKVKLDTGGRTVTSYSAQLAQRIEIYRVGQSTPLTSSTGNFNPGGGGWADGETKTLLTTPLTAQTIENAIAQYGGSGDYHFQVAVQITVTANTNQGAQTVSGSAVGGLNINFQQTRAMSLTAMVTVTPMSLVQP